MAEYQGSLFERKRSILTVTELTRRIKQSLESGFASISLEGEISNFKHHTSGHLYFTLKDESAQISAVMWRSRIGSLAFVPVDGMKVVAHGRITVYEVRGVYQIDVTSLRPAGEGELQLAFEYLKRKLSAEGLFDIERKRPIPEYPECVGIVTSETGAALQDMLNVLRRRMPAIEVILAPARVQGEGAATEIVQAIEDLNRLGRVDVMIIARGGGSLEDLWAFNEESVARALFRSAVPVVTGIGHEIDFTIADFVADLRAPTPSAAAELVVKDRLALLELVRNYWYTLQDEVSTMLSNQKRNILHLLESYSFNKPVDLLRQSSQRVDELERTLASASSHRTALLKTLVTGLVQRIQSLHPEQVLRRGYSIVYRDKEIVGSGNMLNPDDLIDVRFHDATVQSKVL